MRFIYQFTLWNSAELRHQWRTQTLHIHEHCELRKHCFHDNNPSPAERMRELSHARMHARTHTHTSVLLCVSGLLLLRDQPVVSLNDQLIQVTIDDSCSVLTCDDTELRPENLSHDCILIILQCSWFTVLPSGRWEYWWQHPPQTANLDLPRNRIHLPAHWLTCHILFV